MVRSGAATGIPTTPGYVSGIYLQKLLELARGFDIDLTTSLPDIEWPVSADDYATAEFLYGEYLSCVKQLLDETGESNLGLIFGKSFAVRDYGILGYAMLSCRDLEQCLQTFQAHNALFGEVAELERQFEWQDREVVYWCVARHDHESLRRFEVQTSLAQFTGLRSFLEHPEELQFKSVNFSFAPPDDQAPYEALFGANVRFNAVRDEIRIDRTTLQARFALGNEEARSACEAQCEQMSRSMQRSGVLSERIRQIVLESPGSTPEAETIARTLNMSARTLRRRLAEEGSSYQSIITDVRDHLACRYLRETSLAIKEIGYLLGYSEVANFQRAFKSRLGKTPGEYRSEASG